MSSVSYLLQIQKRVHQFEIPVKRSDDLDKKVDLAIKMQERVDIIANRSFSSVRGGEVVSTIGLSFISGNGAD